MCVKTSPKRILQTGKSKNMAKVCDICEKNRGPHGPCNFYKCNEKWRHLVCWPMLCGCAEYWLYGQGPQTRRQVQYALYMIEKYRKKYEERERELKAIECCSKEIYTNLTRIDNIALILALQ